MGLNIPSCSAICRALTCRNLFKFLTSPLCASFVFLFVGLYANSVLQMVAESEEVSCGKDNETCPPLPDLGHMVFPYLHFVKICDYMLYLSVLCTLIRFSPLFVPYSMGLMMLRRWAFLQGLLFWMRGISVALTRQSVPQEDCVTTALGNKFIEGENASAADEHLHDALVRALCSPVSCLPLNDCSVLHHERSARDVR